MEKKKVVNENQLIERLVKKKLCFKLVRLIKAFEVIDVLFVVLTLFSLLISRSLVLISATAAMVTTTALLFVMVGWLKTCKG